MSDPTRRRRSYGGSKEMSSTELPHLQLKPHQVRFRHGHEISDKSAHSWSGSSPHALLGSDSLPSLYPTEKVVQSDPWLPISSDVHEMSYSGEFEFERDNVAPPIKPRGILKSSNRNGSEKKARRSSSTPRLEEESPVAFLRRVSQGEDLVAVRPQKRVEVKENSNLSPFASESHFQPLLPPQAPDKRGKITLVLDIDETLIHSFDTRPVKYDIALPYGSGDARKTLYVLLRPHVEEFLSYACDAFEVVIFTAAQRAYCDLLIRAVELRVGVELPLRLDRSHCAGLGEASFVKDLHLLGRPLHRTAIIDNSPVSYSFQRRNAIPVTSWYDDPNDDELMRLVMFVLPDLAVCEDVYPLLDEHNH